MAKLVWLGEPEGDDDGPRKTVFNGVTMERGKEVEVTNEHMIAKARKNPYFSVDGEVYVPPGRDPHPNAGQPGPRRTAKTELSEMNAQELRDLAAQRGIDVDGLSKADMREKLATAPAELPKNDQSNQPKL